jgi:hypothetical protein
VGVVFMLAGISVGVQAFYIDPRLRFLDKVGTVTTGEVKSSDFYSGRGGRKYNVSFRFVDAPGNFSGRQQCISVSGWEPAGSRYSDKCYLPR